MISNNNKQDIRQNHLDLTDSTLRQYTDMIISSNGEDDSTVSFNGDIDDDDDSDEYAYFIVHYFFFFSFFLRFSLYNISSFLFCLDASSSSSSLSFCSSFIDFYLSGKKHELQARLIIETVCDEVHQIHSYLFQYFKKKKKKSKEIRLS
jgi:hypothetical protein